MQLNIKVIREDLIEGKTEVLAEGRAILWGDTLSYCELDHPDNRHHVTFGSEKIVLKRTAEFPSETTLIPSQSGTAVVHSPYGDMVLETELENWQKDDEKWMVEYRIRNGSDTVSHQRVIWEMREDAGNE